MTDLDYILAETNDTHYQLMARLTNINNTALVYSYRYATATAIALLGYAMFPVCLDKEPPQ